MAAISFVPSTSVYGAGHSSAFGKQLAPSLYREYIDVTNTAKWGVTATTWAAANTIDLIQLPVGTVMLQGGLEIISPETVTTTATIALGTSAAASIFAAAQASNAAAGTMQSVITTNGTNVLVALTTAATLRLTIATAALTNCRFAVWVLLFQAGQVTELA